MTLQEIVEFAGDKVGTPDSDSLTIAKQFARRRYQMLWNRHAWKDTLVYFSDTLDAAENTIVCPADVERVMALRLGTDTRAFPVNNTDIFLTDPAAFERTGTATRWQEMPALCQDYTPSFAEGPWAASASDSADYGKTCTAIWIDTNGKIQKSTTTITAIASYDMAMSTLVSVVSFSINEAPVGSVLLIATDPLQGDGVATISAGTTTAPMKQRMRVFDTPTASTAVYGLGKRRFPDFTNDSEAPIIRGLDLALLSYVEGDMLARQRQRGKAAMCYAEAESHVSSLINEERNQGANNLRVIPWVEGPPTSSYPSNKAYF
jgi:hypothetical protein